MSVNLLYFRLWSCETCEQFGSCGQKHHTAHRLLNSLKSLILSVFTYHYMIVYSGVGYTFVQSTQFKKCIVTETLLLTLFFYRT